MKAIGNSSGKSIGKTVKKCPACGSRNITLWMGGSLGIQYFCKKCGYHGPLIVEESTENK